MQAVLDIIKDYGAAAAVVISIIMLVVVFATKGSVSKSMRKIIRLKDDFRWEKAQALKEALSLLNELEVTPFEERKLLLVKLQDVSNKLYTLVLNPRLIQIYDKVVVSLLSGGVSGLHEFESLVRGELSLTPIKKFTKRNYTVFFKEEEKLAFQKEEKEREKQLLLEQKQKEKELLLEQKEAQKLQKELEKEQKEQMKKLAQENKRLEEERKAEEKKAEEKKEAEKQEQKEETEE